MTAPAATALLALALLSAPESRAQGLADPTRPPNFAGLPFGATPAAPSGPLLQSIVLSPKRRLAVIDGKLVGIGDRVGDATLVAIEIDSVRLREGGGTRVLKLLPEVRKRETETAGLPAGPKQNPTGDVQ